MKRIVITILLAGAIAIGGLFAYQNRHQIQQDVLSVGVPEAVTFEEIGAEDAGKVVAAEEDRSNATDRTYEQEIAQEDTLVDAGDLLEDASVGGKNPTPTSQNVQEDSGVPAVPVSINLAIPFTSQAPHSNWGLPYQEACEEASVLMAVSFFDNTLVDLSSADSADKAILDIVALETEKYDLYLDTTVAETKRFAEAMFPDYSFNIVQDPTVDEIKSALASGSPVIVPAAGRELGNPNFSGAGPLYHMLVVRGYTDSTFVTNDPGTRNGNGYVYKQTTIMNAMGDWNGGDPANGAKVVIVVSKK